MNLLANIARTEQNETLTAPEALRKRGNRWLKAAAAGGLLVLLVPLGSWLMGSGVAMVAPHTYRSTAIVHLPDSYDRAAVEQEKQRMRSSEVADLASRALSGRAGQGAMGSMDSYLLWSSVEAETDTEPETVNAVRLAVRAPDAVSAQRKLQAVVDAYQSMAASPAGDSATESSFACVMPVESLQVGVSAETRIILGLAGFSALALILSIPLLKRLENEMPVRAAVA